MNSTQAASKCNKSKDDCRVVSVAVTRVLISLQRFCAELVKSQNHLLILNHKTMSTLC